jgi:hypothetical protein
MKPTTLSPDQVEHFIEHGFTYLRGGFTRQMAEPVLAQVWAAMDSKRDDPTTWTKQVDSPRKGEHPKGPDVAALYTPRVRGAFDDLLGAGRWQERGDRTGAWPCAFPGFDHPPSAPPTGGWHVDGGLARTLCGAGQALIAIMFFSDIGPGDGGTGVRPGSHKIAARLMRDIPFSEQAYSQLLHKLDHEVPAFNAPVEAQGEIGDLILCHSYLSHSRYPNTGKKVRIITNNCISLNEAWPLERPNPDDYSPYETAIVRALDEVKA